MTDDQTEDFGSWWGVVFICHRADPPHITTTGAPTAEPFIACAMARGWLPLALCVQVCCCVGEQNPLCKWVVLRSFEHLLLTPTPQVQFAGQVAHRGGARLRVYSEAVAN